METCGDAEDFVARFAEFWMRPSPQRLPGLLHPEVVLVQPLAAPTIGIEAAQADLAIERVTYFDSLVVVPRLLRHPSIWWRWLRSQTIRA